MFCRGDIVTKPTILWMYRELHKYGCDASTSEIKDTIDILSNTVDVHSVDQSTLRNILYSTIGKTKACRMAIDLLTMDQQFRQIMKMANKEAQQQQKAQMQNTMEVKPFATRHGMTPNPMRQTSSKQSMSSNGNLQTRPKGTPSKQDNTSQTHNHASKGSPNAGTRSTGTSHQKSQSNTTMKSNLYKHTRPGTQQESAQSSKTGTGIVNGQMGRTNSQHGINGRQGTTSGSSICKIEREGSAMALMCNIAGKRVPVYSGKYDTEHLHQAHTLKQLIEEASATAKDLNIKLNENMVKNLVQQARNEGKRTVSEEKVRMLQNMLRTIRKMGRRGDATTRALLADALERNLHYTQNKGLNLQSLLKDVRKEMAQIKQAKAEQIYEESPEAAHELEKDFEKEFLKLRFKKKVVPSTKTTKKLHLRKTVKSAMRTGTPITLYYKKKKNNNPDFYFIADVSGSMADYIPEELAMLNAARKILGVKGQVFSFVNRIYPFNKGKVGGYTDFAGLLRDIPKYVTDKRKPIIIFTDVRRGFGESPADVIDDLRRRGYKVYVIDPEDIQRAEEGDSEFEYIPPRIRYTAPTMEDLAKAFADIVRKEER